MKEHPASDGWQILRNTGQLLFLLPEFGEDMRMNRIMKPSGIIYAVSHKTSFPPGKTEPEFEIKKRRWTGNIYLEWQGSPIVLRSLYYEEERGPAPYFLIAVKNWEAFNAFFKALLYFEARKFKNRLTGNSRAFDDEIKCETLSGNGAILPPDMAEDPKSTVETEKFRHTKSNLGEFVQKAGELYFVRSEKVKTGLDKINFLVAGRQESGLKTRLAGLAGYSLAAAIMLLLLCLILLFPVFLFALPIGSVVLKHINEALRS